MQTGRLEITEEQVGNARVVRVLGSIHLGNSPELRNVLQRLVKEGAAAVVVSLDGADRVDTSGLATFVESAQEMHGRGGRLIVSGLNEEMTDTLSLQQVRSVFPILPTEAEALAQVQGE